MQVFGSFFETATGHRPEGHHARIARCGRAAWKRVVSQRRVTAWTDPAHAGCQQRANVARLGAAVRGLIAKEKTRLTRSRVVYEGDYTSSPIFWFGVASSRISKLMTGEVGRDEILPKVSADSCSLCSAERAGDLPRGRIDQADWYTFARLLHRQHQVRVVGDDQDGIDSTEKYVQQQVRRHVDVASLLFPVRDRDHEPRIPHLRSSGVLHHYGPVWRDQARPACRPLYGQRGELYACDIPAELNEIDAAGRNESLQADVLVGEAGPILRRVNPCRAIDNAIDPGVRPVRALMDQRFCHCPDVQPAPPGGAASAQTASAVVHVASIHINAYPHLSVSQPYE